MNYLQKFDVKRKVSNQTSNTFTKYIIVDSISLRNSELSIS